VSLKFYLEKLGFAITAQRLHFVLSNSNHKQHQVVHSSLSILNLVCNFTFFILFLLKKIFILY